MTAHHALDDVARRALLTALRDTSWSWREVDVPTVAAALGWDIVKLTPAVSATVDPGHGLGGRAYRFSFRDGRVSDVILRISSGVEEDDPAGQLFLGDVFAGARAAGIEVLGAPTSTTPGRMPQVRWRRDGATIVLQSLPTVVTVFWRCNERQDELDRIAENFRG